MKIIISKSEFQSKLKLVSKIIQPNKVNAAYDNFLFELNDGILQVSAADESGWIKTTIEYQSVDEENMFFTINAKTLLDAIGQLPEQPVTLTLTSKGNFNEVLLNYAGGHFSMLGGVYKGFETTTLPVPGEVQMPISSLDMLYGLRRTYFRAANDELRPVMNGVYLDQVGSAVTFVASDGSTLSMMEYSGDGTERSGIIFPRKICKVLIDILPPEDEKASYVVRGNNTVFQHSLFTLSYRMIEGKYPNYRAVIPKDNNKKAVIERLPLVALLKRVLVAANKNSNLIKLTLSDGKLQVNSVNLDLSMSADEIISIEYTNKQMSIGFNGEFLLDLLVNMQTTDSVCLLLSDPTRAAIVTDAEPIEGETLTYIIMPMAINF